MQTEFLVRNIKIKTFRKKNQVQLWNEVFLYYFPKIYEK